MIQGIVNARRAAIVRIRLRGPSGVESVVDALVDTGFTSSLTLPAATIVSLGLVRHSRGRAVLADGAFRQFDVYSAEVEWGQLLAVAIGVSPWR